MQSTTRTSGNEAYDPENWPSKEEGHLRSVFDQFMVKLAEANRYETHANIWSRRIRRRFWRQDSRRDQATLDKFVNEDPLWKGIVANQQFANREAQMYGIAALLLEQQVTNEYLQRLFEKLDDIQVDLHGQMRDMNAQKDPKVS